MIKFETHISLFQDQTSDKSPKIRKRTKAKHKKELSSADKRRIEQNKKLHKKLLDIQNGVGRKKPSDADYDGNERWHVLLKGFFLTSPKTFFRKYPSYAFEKRYKDNSRSRVSF